MISDYPDLMAELLESARTLNDTKLAARATYDAAHAAAAVIMNAAKGTFDAACNSAERQNTTDYAVVRERSITRDAAKEAKLKELL